MKIIRIICLLFALPYFFPPTPASAVDLYPWDEMEADQRAVDEAVFSSSSNNSEMETLTPPREITVIIPTALHPSGTLPSPTLIIPTLTIATLTPPVLTPPVLTQTVQGLNRGLIPPPDHPWSHNSSSSEGNHSNDSNPFIVLSSPDRTQFSPSLLLLENDANNMTSVANAYAQNPNVCSIIWRFRTFCDSSVMLLARTTNPSVPVVNIPTLVDNTDFGFRLEINRYFDVQNDPFFNEKYILHNHQLGRLLPPLGFNRIKVTGEQLNTIFDIETQLDQGSTRYDRDVCLKTVTDYTVTFIHSSVQVPDDCASFFYELGEF